VQHVSASLLAADLTISMGRVQMKKVLVLLSFLISAKSVIAADLMPTGAPLEKMPETLEVAFALSALPPHLKNDATVYVLDPTKGYVTAKTGVNGFSCIVERTEWERAEFRNDIYTPICFDSEGSRKILPVWTDTAALRAQGQLSPADVKTEISRRFAIGQYVAPSRTGISYMLAPLMRTYPAASDMIMTMSMPHYMFYAPNVSDKDIGGLPLSPYPFILGEGPHGYIILLAGAEAKAKILDDNKGLVTELCSYRSLLCLDPAMNAHQHDSAKTENNKAIIQRFLNDVIDHGNFATYDELFDAGFVNQDVVPGFSSDFDGFIKLLKSALLPFPDKQVTIESLVGEGDKVVASIYVSGTNTGAFQGNPPTGKNATWSEIHIYTLKGGKIVSHHGIVDLFAIQAQLQSSH
jgi:predicted ester cyclase